MYDDQCQCAKNICSVIKNRTYSTIIVSGTTFKHAKSVQEKKCCSTLVHCSSHFKLLFSLIEIINHIVFPCSCFPHLCIFLSFSWRFFCWSGVTDRCLMDCSQFLQCMFHVVGLLYCLHLQLDMPHLTAIQKLN